MQKVKIKKTAQLQIEIKSNDFKNYGKYSMQTCWCFHLAFICINLSIGNLSSIPNLTRLDMR
jgi:hypothetical protein